MKYKQINGSVNRINCVAYQIDVLAAIGRKLTSDDLN